MHRQVHPTHRVHVLCCIEHWQVVRVRVALVAIAWWTALTALLEREGVFSTYRTPCGIGGGCIAVAWAVYEVREPSASLK